MKHFRDFLQMFGIWQHFLDDFLRPSLLGVFGVPLSTRRAEKRKKCEIPDGGPPGHGGLHVRAKDLDRQALIVKRKKV